MRAFNALSETVLRHAEARLPALTRLRQPEALPILLDRRRIYVLPTRFGLAFAALLAVMTLGALNYDNNPALILCFVLGSAAHTSLLMAYLALRGLRLVDAHAIPVHAGEMLNIHLRFESGEHRAAKGLRISIGSEQVPLDLDVETATVSRIQVPAVHRGQQALGRISISVRRPLGLFVAWSWLNPQRSFLVYPRPEPKGPELPRDNAGGVMRRGRSVDEQVHNLRDYRPGDPLRAMAWKRTAQLGRAVVREFERPSGEQTVLDWNSLVGLDTETRISRLTRWLLEAEQRGVRSELRLPNETLGPGLGSLHLQTCLTRLALLPRASA